MLTPDRIGVIVLVWFFLALEASGDRSCREQLAGAPGWRKLDRRVDFFRGLLFQGLLFAARRKFSQRIFAPLPRQAERCGESSGGEEIGDSTLLDAAQRYEASGDRSCREQLAGAPGWRKLDRRVDWALSSSFRCRSEAGFA
jgi:hypothetical protein